METSQECERLAESALRDALYLDELAGGVFDYDDDDDAREWLVYHGFEDPEERPDFFDVLDVAALEVVAEGSRSFATGEWVIESMRIVLGTGGPHVEVTAYAGYGRLVAAAYWGSDVSRRHGRASGALFEYLAEIAEVAV